jgi:spore germination protein GerM
MKAFFSRDRLLLIAFLLVLLVFGALVLRMYRLPTPASKSEAPVAQEESRRLREVLLYFGDANGVNLAAETREIEDCLEEADCIGSTVQALVNGPVRDLVPILPAHAVVRGVAVNGGTAVIDFSRELVTAHPGGSASELLTVYGLANTLAENFPHVRQVQILVEGEPVESLKGHVDLRGPIQADFSFSRLPDEGAKE